MQEFSQRSYSPVLEMCIKIVNKFLMQEKLYVFETM